MDNFNDIFAGAGTKETEQAPKDDFDVEQWKTQKAEDKITAFALSDDMADTVSADGNEMQKFFDLQSRFGKSANNVLLIMAQKPDAKFIGDMNYWKSKGVYLKSNSTPIIQLKGGNDYQKDDGSIGTGYNPVNCYDISDTKNGKFKAPIAFNDRTKLKALISESPAEVQLAPQIEDGKLARFDENEGKLYVKMNESNADEVFRQVAQEMAFAEFSERDDNFTRDDYAFGAYAVSYMLCKKNGVDTQNFDFSRLPARFAEFEAQETKAELSSISKCLSEITKRMDRVYAQVKSQKDKSDAR